MRARTSVPPAAEVEDAPEESVEVEDDPEFDESVEVEVSEEPDELLPEPLLELLAAIVRVQVLTSRTAALPLSSVMGVSAMTQVCVIAPEGLSESEYVCCGRIDITCARIGRGLGHDGCGLSILTREYWDCIREEKAVEEKEES
jgi:hypothetical protein